MKLDNMFIASMVADIIRVCKIILNITKINTISYIINLIKYHRLRNDFIEPNLVDSLFLTIGNIVVEILINKSEFTLPGCP